MHPDLHVAGSRAPSALDYSVMRYYERWWENQQDIRSIIFDRLNQIVRNRISLRSPGTALDLGSGRGRVLSMLIEAGFETTAIEFNPHFAATLRTRFPRATVITADVRDWQPEEEYDLVTCIELSQVLTHIEFGRLLTAFRPYTRRVITNVSNRRSLHGIWVRLRRFQAPFVVTYTARDLVRVLENARYEVVFTAGVGFLTPLSLLREFKAPIVTQGVAKRFAKLDECFPNLAHLLLVEAEPKAVPEALA